MNKLTGFYGLILAGFLYSCSGSVKETDTTKSDSLTVDSATVSEEEQFIQQQPLTDVVPEYKTYEGDGFTIDYPANVMALNQDSSGFVNGDGTAIIELEVKHYYLGDEDEPSDLDTHYKNLLSSKNMAKIVYKAKGKDYCVISGTEGGEIFYIKSVAFELLKPDENTGGNLLVRSDLITMKFTYLDADKDFYNPIAAVVSKSFQFHP
jgi:hypothetical protein